jgi:hypothetical protein
LEKQLAPTNTVSDLGNSKKLQRPLGGNEPRVGTNWKKSQFGSTKHLMVQSFSVPTIVLVGGKSLVFEFTGVPVQPVSHFLLKHVWSG